ncbi:hypothetical protein [Sphingomonas sp. OK281]|uniref:hypothetical protein n=1 Tax=Sphingomonas sp. OK281 TaxID=1881067 RepID=UPI0015878EEC|nr:hypothetical protein [Sphingomonas sp. OK281]
MWKPEISSCVVTMPSPSEGSSDAPGGRSSTGLDAFSADDSRSLTKSRISAAIAGARSVAIGPIADHALRRR